MRPCTHPRRCAERVGGDCGIYGGRPCNITYLALVCDATPGCEVCAVDHVRACNHKCAAYEQGFNSNGWLKECLPPRCVAALEPTGQSDLYVKDGPPAPPLPLPDIADPFYPLEEASEAAAADVPRVLAVSSDSRWCGHVLQHSPKVCAMVRLRHGATCCD